MQFLKDNMLAFVGIVIALGAVFVYYTYFADGSGAAFSSTGGNSVSPVSQELLVSLQNLHTIKLDETIFTNSKFLSLTNFGVTIPPQEAGRRNPFMSTTGSAQKSGTDVGIKKGVIAPTTPR